jgi:hypothetical protein
MIDEKPITLLIDDLEASWHAPQLRKLPLDKTAAGGSVELDGLTDQTGGAT